MDGFSAPQPYASCATQRFDDADDFTRAVVGTGVEYVPLQAGRYEAHLTVIRSGDTVLQCAVDRAHVTRGAMGHDVVGLLVPLWQDAAPTVNGLRTDIDDGVILGPAAELHVLCPAAVTWAALMMPLATANALTEFAGPARMTDLHGATLRLPRQVVGALQRAGAAARDAAAAATTGAATPDLAVAIVASVTDHLLSAFADAELPAVPRATREAMRIFHAAEAMLHARPDRPLLTEPLCDALGISPRSLHKAFVAVAGTSPQAYLRRRRLMLVHATLKRGGGDAGLVKSVALANGFWHLGHFARSYRAQFGQTPSETLAFARAGAYRRAVFRSGLGRVQLSGNG